MIAAGFGVTPAAAQRYPGTLPEESYSRPNRKLPELEGTEVVEKLEARIPLDLEFRDESGAPIRLGSIFSDGLPVILTFNYSNCPMLCSVQLGGLVDVLRQMDWQVGAQFRIVTIALDPTQTPERTRETKAAYLERYPAPRAAEGWRFLSGSAETVRALANAVGYGYRFLAEKNEYAHPAALIFLSPSGVVTRYIYGVKYEKEHMRDSIASAVLGRAQEAPERFLLACFHYEPPHGRSALARDLMRYGGMAFLVGAAGVYFFALRRRNAVHRGRSLERDS
jgi:protein SCO1/2